MIVDTGVFVAASNGDEPYHESCAALLQSAPGAELDGKRTNRRRAVAGGEGFEHAPRCRAETTTNRCGVDTENHASAVLVRHVVLPRSPMLGGQSLGCGDGLVRRSEADRRRARVGVKGNEQPTTQHQRRDTRTAWWRRLRPLTPDRPAGTNNRQHTTATVQTP